MANQQGKPMLTSASLVNVRATLVLLGLVALANVSWWFSPSNFIVLTVQTFEGLQHPVTTASALDRARRELLQEFDPSIQKIWTCGGKNNSGIVVFVHVFKAAGSSLRVLFREYSDACQVSCATLIRCSNLSHNSSYQQDSVWENGHGREKGTPCDMKKGLFRNGTAMQDHRVVTSRYLREHVDLLMGHLPVGTHAAWEDQTNKLRVNAQYITFVREPIHKYVSGVLFTTKKKHLSFNETVDLIRDRVTKARAENLYYEGYTKYLTSPMDKQMAFRQESSRGIENRIGIILKNLVRHHFVVGSVENMYQSLQMIQYAIDSTHRVSNVFEKFGMTTDSSRETYRANESVLSTSAIVQALQQDPAFWKEIQEFLKYDAVVHAFGLELHQLQYQWFMSQM